MEKVCESLREHTMKMINFKKKKNEVINKIAAGRKHMKIQKSVIFVTEILKINIGKIKNIVKLEITLIIQGNIEVLCIVYVI